MWNHVGDAKAGSLLIGMSLMLFLTAGCDQPAGSQAPPATQGAAAAARVATAREALHKQLADTTWTNKQYQITLNADGTIRHSEPQLAGTWGVVGDRKIAIPIDEGHVDLWQFDEQVRSYTARSYRHNDHTYTGQRLPDAAK